MPKGVYTRTIKHRKILSEARIKRFDLIGRKFANPKQYQKYYYNKNKEILLENNKNYRKKHIESYKKYCQEYANKNREKLKQYRKEYRIKNREKLTIKYLERRKNDHKFRFETNCRARIKILIRKGLLGREKNTFKLIGCDWNFLKEYIEKKFKDGMTWENYGKWHIDHIKPFYCAKNKEEVSELCHYTNLQPLWAKENLIKNKFFNQV